MTDRPTHLVDGVLRYLDGDLEVVGTEGNVDATTIPEPPASTFDAGATIPEPPAADPGNPTVTQLYDAHGHVAGTIDSTTGEFTPAG